MSIENSYLDTDLGHIVFVIKNPENPMDPANEMEPGIISIEYKDVNMNNVEAGNQTVFLYDINYTIDGNAKIFHIINTKIQIIMIKDSLSLFISFNGFNLSLRIESEEIYDRIMKNCNKVMKEIKRTHKNRVITSRLPVNNGSLGLIGSYLAGDSNNNNNNSSNNNNNNNNNNHNNNNNNNNHNNNNHNNNNHGGQRKLHKSRKSSRK